MKYPKHTEQDAIALVKNSGTAFAAKARRALPASLPPKLLTKHQALLGPDYGIGMLPASHAGLRYQVFESLKDSLIALARERPETVFAHFTIIDEVWNTGDRVTEIRLASIEKRLRNALAKYRLSFFAILELQAYLNVYHGEQGRLLTPHLHVIAWSSEPTDFQGIAEAIERRFHVPSVFREGNKPARSVVASPLSSDPSDLAWRAGYLLKSPEEAMTLFRSADGTDVRTYSSDKANRFIVFSRLAEVLSQLELPDILFASGEGRGIRRQALRDMEDWAWAHQKQPYRGLHGTSAQIELFWQRLRRAQGREDLEPLMISRSNTRARSELTGTDLSPA